MVEADLDVLSSINILDILKRCQRGSWRCLRERSRLKAEIGSHFDKDDILKPADWMR